MHVIDEDIRPARYAWQRQSLDSRQRGNTFFTTSRRRCCRAEGFARLHSTLVDGGAGSSSQAGAEASPLFGIAFA